MTTPSKDLHSDKKLRLNAEQWQTLQGLATDPAAAKIERHAARIGRLTSNGLVALDRRGCAYLTIFGFQRLRQGR
ncbi:hypothetical protein QTH91_07220 [Variovorax dokdonensis]|uniref:DUF4224 domain-containing protein n=1 Tax=Variovorax dokdonensis TaxID=344883 RepID=A0ABT7N8K4_9BURK|nr:hypothetical protein [Variovorax dokdonensis]MDM0044265.1 hypothetical protein [Variovorax dokdonensis]